jgi:hypothetical protein
MVMAGESAALRQSSKGGWRRVFGIYPGDFFEFFFLLQLAFDEAAHWRFLLCTRVMGFTASSLSLFSLSFCSPSYVVLALIFLSLSFLHRA